MPLRTNLGHGPANAFRYKGGLARIVDPAGWTSASRKGGGSAKSGWDPLGFADKPKPVTPTPVDPLANVPAPPVTMSNLDVVNSQQDFLHQEMMKKSIKKTIYAGDTGGWKG